jgi:hypothetical protein
MNGENKLNFQFRKLIMLILSKAIQMNQMLFSCLSIINIVH